jgi:DNA-binding transcriptional ArsR family regulator
MSVQALSWAQVQKTGSPTRKLVLLALADFADDRHVAWPSIASLSSIAEASPRTIQRALSDLEELGLIERVGRHRHDGAQTSNRFLLRVEGGGDKLTGGGDRMTRGGATDCHRGGDTGDRGGVTPVSPLGEPPKGVPLEPPVEPPVEEEHTHPGLGRFDPDATMALSFDAPAVPSGPSDLEGYLGEWADQVLPLYRDRSTWGGHREESGIFQQFGPPGMDPVAWRDGTGTLVPPQDRPRLLALAMLRLATEGQRYQAKLLSLILRAVIREANDSGGGARASPPAMATTGAGAGLQKHLERWGGLDE